MGRVPCSTFSAHSIHMAMWPHGTSNAHRGSSRQTAHGSASSAVARSGDVEPSVLSISGLGGTSSSELGVRTLAPVGLLRAAVGDGR